MTTSPQSVSSTPAPATPNTTVPSTATPSTPAVQEPKRRRGRAPAAPSNSFSFYDGAVSPDGSIASIGKRFETEIDAQKASVRSGKPYFEDRNPAGGVHGVRRQAGSRRNAGKEVVGIGKQVYLSLLTSQHFVTETM